MFLDSTVYASGFFGIRIFDPDKPFSSGLIDLEVAKKAFKMAYKDEEGKVHYDYSQSMADDSIYCYVWLSEKEMVIDIYNYSKKYIELNYFSDKYYLISRDGSFYIPEIDSSSYKPRVLNPKNHLLFALDCNMDGININEITYVMISLDFGEYCLFLRRIGK
jgi:hypothetical protein